MAIVPRVSMRSPSGVDTLMGHLGDVHPFPPSRFSFSRILFLSPTVSLLAILESPIVRCFVFLTVIGAGSVYLSYPLFLNESYGYQFKIFPRRISSLTEISMPRTRYIPRRCFRTSSGGKSKRPPKKIDGIRCEFTRALVAATRLSHTEIFLIIPRIDRADRFERSGGGTYYKRERSRLSRYPWRWKTVGANRFSIVLAAVWYRKEKQIAPERRREEKKEKLYLRRLCEVYTIKRSRTDIFVNFHAFTTISVSIIYYPYLLFILLLTYSLEAL